MVSNLIKWKQKIKSKNFGVFCSGGILLLQKAIWEKVLGAGETCRGKKVKGRRWGCRAGLEAWRPLSIALPTASALPSNTPTLPPSAPSSKSNPTSQRQRAPPTASELKLVIYSAADQKVWTKLCWKYNLSFGRTIFALLMELQTSEDGIKDTLLLQWSTVSCCSVKHASLEIFAPFHYPFRILACKILQKYLLAGGSSEKIKYMQRLSVGK